MTVMGISLWDGTASFPPPTVPPPKFPPQMFPPIDIIAIETTFPYYRFGYVWIVSIVLFYLHKWGESQWGNVTMRVMSAGELSLGK